MRIIQVVCDIGHLDTIKGIAEQLEVADIWWHPSDEQSRCTASLLVRPGKRQDVLDSLQKVLDSDETAHIIVGRAGAVLSRSLKRRGDDEEGLFSADVSREELRDDVERGARLDRNYLLLVLLSTIVATIGLIENNIAVVVGAMVIAPLLGPNIALALGSVLGDARLISRAVKCVLAGLALAISLATIIALLYPLQQPYSQEIMSRTEVALAGVALALASGAAGALSITRGLPSVLVGVMVAVALLPPAATVGLMLGSGEHRHALDAALLLMMNIVCINLSAMIMFVGRGLKPRTWMQQQKARTSATISTIAWGLSLGILILVIYLKSSSAPA